MKVPIHKIERYSSSTYRAHVKGVRTLKNTEYRVLETAGLPGDAPKLLMCIYDYEDAHKKGYHKRNIDKWPKYLAKTGHKWYPMESITELLLNRLGSVFGMCMAEATLMNVGGQCRFLSKLFRTRKNSLVHGAEIFTGYLGDKDFVYEIEECNLAQECFTLQFIEEAIGYLFPIQQEDIMGSLVKMLLFDALVGNNDRHFENWGVLTSPINEFQPFFSPVYDTARGLFWNDSEDKIKDRLRCNTEQQIQKYCKLSKPKIGWKDSPKRLAHFDLVERIVNDEFYISRNEAKELFQSTVKERMFTLIDKDFSSLMSSERIKVIKMCLDYRFQEINKRIL